MSWKTAEERLATSLPTYESRPQQTALATKIENALASRKVLFGQAGTGTGKSFAALIPAIEHAIATGRSVVVATATKALQDQYVGDLEFLQAHLGVDFNWAVLKGRGNYPCMAKLAELDPATILNGNQLLEELEIAENTIDLDSLITELDPRDRPKLTSSSDECPGKRDCPFGDVCYAEAAKAAARAADVIVVNHALLVTDLVVREVTGGEVQMLGDFDAVIVDEGHEFEEYTTSALGSEMSVRSLTSLGTEIANFLGDPNAVSSLMAAAQGLFTAMGRVLGNDKTAELSQAVLVRNAEAFGKVTDALRLLATEVRDVDTYGNDAAKNRSKRLLRRISSTVTRVVRVVSEDAADLVRWVENDEKRGTILKFAPLHVGEFLNRMLWNGMDEEGDSFPRSAVILSATLALGDDFSYIAGRLGAEEYLSFDAGTPFAYPKQAAVFIPSSGCDPSQGSSWEGRLVATIDQLVIASGGRALLLFTSRRSMDKAHAAVADRMADAGIQVLKQGDAPNKRLAAEFKRDETSVLFALRSFMTGVDVQGDALRLVIIDKMPFPVPTDVIVKARAQAIDDEVARTGQNKWVHGSFNTMTVPGMALVLMQAFGRLIRTKNDEGLVVILDDRIHTKKYGKRILAALPPARRLTTLAQAQGYLAELTARRG